MTTITFDELPQAVTELNRKVDELYDIITSKQSKDSADQFLSVKETAKFLNLSVPTIYSKVSRRELPYIKRGKRLYFSMKDLETYLKEGRIKTVDELEAEADQYLTSKKRRV